MSVLKIAKDDADDNLLNALFEAFSMMKDVNSLKTLIDGHVQYSKVVH